MEKEELIQLILEKTTDSLREKMPQDMGDNRFGGAIKLDDMNSFFQQMWSGLRFNGAVSDEADISQDRKNLSRASAFAVSAVTGIYMTYALGECIDEFFENPENNQYFEGYSDKQKTELRDNLKNTVKDRLAVDAKTEKGRALVEKLEERFRTCETVNGQPESRLHEYKSSMAALNSLVYTMVGLGNKNALLGIVKRNTKDEDKSVKIITEALENGSDEIAKEEKAVDWAVAMFDRSDGEKTVDAQEFLEHYNSKKGLSEQEKKWAVQQFDSLGLDHVDFLHFKSDGEPMFTFNQVSEMAPDDKKIGVIANALMGKSVVLENHGKETLISENLHEPLIKDESEKSWWERLIDFIKDKLGIGRDEKQRINQVRETHDDFVNKFADRISFKELSGINALEMVTGGSKKKTELSAEKGGLSK